MMFYRIDRGKKKLIKWSRLVSKSLLLGILIKGAGKIVCLWWLINSVCANAQISAIIIAIKNKIGMQLLRYRTQSELFSNFA